MNSLYITQHLGLGDAIICQAIIKTYAKKYDKIVIPIYNIYIQSITEIYKQFSNVQFDIIQFRKTVQNPESYECIRKNIINFNGSVLRIGFFSPIYNNICKKYKTLNATFYIPAKIPQEEQWNIPVVTRNNERQIQLFNSYKIQGQYSLIVQDKARINEICKPMVIERSYIRDKEIQQINFKKVSNNIFDNCYLLENASEIHTFDTAITHVLDQCCNITGDKIFNHKYIRCQQKQIVNQYKHSFNDIW